jgi:tetratricopeptide (TPR) repeat protein
MSMMRVASFLRLCLLLAAILAAGCQTDRRGVEVDLGALLRAYREQLDRKPGRAEAERIVAALPAEQLNDLGVLYEREGRLADAAWAYQRAIWREPRFAPAYVNLGNVLRRQGKTAEARLRYRQAMNADPHSFEAVNNFADLCAEEQVYLEEAIARLEPMIEQAGVHRGYGLDTLGRLHHLVGDDEKAARALEAALHDPAADDPSLRASVHEHLAAVYRSLGREAEAAQQEAEAERLKRLGGQAGGPR